MPMSDIYTVSEGHSLAIPGRHEANGKACSTQGGEEGAEIRRGAGAFGISCALASNPPANR